MSLPPALCRGIWRSNGLIRANEAVEILDRHFQTTDGYRYVVGEALVSGGAPLVFEETEEWKESYWNAIIAKWKIRSNNSRYYLACVAKSKERPVNPRDVYLGTWMIDEKAPYHGVLLGRVRETATYGLLKSFEWFGFFASLGNPNLPELQAIADLVRRSDGVPLKVKKADNSQISSICLFYNIQNLIECLLNICNLRYSLSKRVLIVYTSDSSGEHEHRINLDSILDELVYTYATDPKNICKAIRGYLTLAIRASGCNALRQATYRHESLSMTARDHGGPLKKETFDGKDFFRNYVESKAMSNGFVSGQNVLKELKMEKLSAFIDVYLSATLTKTDPRDYVMCGSFLHSIMALAGYGRALNYASSPRSAEPLDRDELGIADEIESIIVDLDSQAREKGFHPPSGSRWIPASIATWRSTSAGVAPITIKIIRNGVASRVKVRKKAAIGIIKGRSAFSRKELGEVTSKTNPGSVGYRDVPYKPTRAIYVVRLPTQYAQVAVISHLVAFISTMGNSQGMVGKRIDPSHFTTGPCSTTGLRLNDTYDTIAASGNRQLLALGSDLSNFDSSCVWWNFRKPMISALLRVLRGETFGPDEITAEEMVHFAYGKGIIYDSIWDNGREPLVLLRDDISDQDRAALSAWTEVINVGNETLPLKPLPGAKALPPGPATVFKIDDWISEGRDVPWHKLRVAIRCDGHDLIKLTSEASGELSTLMMNTVANLAMQRIALKLLKGTNFGKKFTPVYMKGVGDDAEWIGELLPVESARDIDDALEMLSDTYAKMGHTFSAAKTYVMPLSSEYVQTYARFGLMIPKDQIMLIASEKPRSVRDVVGYANSLKHVLLTKCARGFNLDYAVLLLLYLFRALNRISLTRHQVNVEKEFRKLSVPLSSKLKIEVRNLSLRRVSDEYRAGAKARRSFSISVCHALLPSVAGGMGLYPLLPNVTLTPALFLRMLALCDQPSRDHLFASYMYFSTRPLNTSIKEGDDDVLKSVELPSEFKKLSVSDIFSPAVQRNLKVISDVSVGRLNAELVPKILARKGLEMETFMENEANADREVHAETFLSALALPMRAPAFDADEWVLSYTYTQKDIAGGGQRLARHYTGLASDYETLLDAYGMSTASDRLHGAVDALRIAISTDPVLKGIVAPEAVIDLLDRHGVVSLAERSIGFALLCRCGFEPRTVDRILEIRFNANFELTSDPTYGALTDDFSSALNLFTRRRHDEFSFPPGFDVSARRTMLLFASQLSLMLSSLRGTATIVIGAKLSDVLRDSIGKGWHIRFPLTYRRVVKKNRDRARLTTAIIADLSSMM